MKKYVQMGLISLLIVLLYKVPEFLMDFIDNTIGKLILLCVCAIIYDKYGYQTALLAALIVIVLLYQLQEGFITLPKISASFSIGEGMSNNQKFRKNKKREAFSNYTLSPSGISASNMTDQDRNFKMKGERAKFSASQQSNGFTN